MLEYWKVIILGIVEGLTEFLPVSSTGHLILVAEALDLSGSSAASFEIFIQLGAILAVVVLYRQRFLNLLNFKSSHSFAGYHGLKLIFFACLPVLILGFFTHKFIKQYLFNSLSVALALVFGGLVMLWVENRKVKPLITSIEQLTIKQALQIGLFQCFSLWSGISRSGSTIVGGLLGGVDRKTAAEFSFLVAVPVMCVAVGYDLLKSWGNLSQADLQAFGLGFLVSFGSAILAIRVFMHLIGRYSLSVFAYYRILLGLVILTLAI